MKNVFQQVFLTVVFLTAISGCTAFSLASYSTLSPQQARIFESSTTTWQMGVGAIFGLLGSKSTDLFRSQNKTDEDETE